MIDIYDMFIDRVCNRYYRKRLMKLSWVIYLEVNGLLMMNFYLEYIDIKKSYSKT